MLLLLRVCQNTFYRTTDCHAFLVSIFTDSLTVKQTRLALKRTTYLYFTSMSFRRGSYFHKWMPPHFPLSTNNKTIMSIYSENNSIMNDTFIEALKQGEPEAYYRLIEENNQHLRHFLNAILQSQEDAEDITQDVFIYIWENRHQLSDIRYLKTYIFSIAKYKALKKISDKQRYVIFEDMTESGTFADSPEEILEYSQMHGQLQTIIRNLPEMRRKVYEMRMEEEKSYDEIAEGLIISASTARSHFQSAIRQIRENWEKSQEQGST